MRKVQFGAGSLGIPGWENHDLDVDITRPLPFPEGSVDVVFSEMCIEHVTPQQGWSFLEECYRILRSGGLIRITIPDFVRCLTLKDPAWLKVNQEVTGNDGSIRDQMKSILFAHGHQALYSAGLLRAVMQAVGFVKLGEFTAGNSEYEPFRDIEQHWRSVGREAAFAESGCVEGRKPASETI